MANLVVIRPYASWHLPSWLPLRELVRLRRPHHGDPRDCLQRISTWCQDEGGHPGAWYRPCAMPDLKHAESARWLRALSVESRLLRWTACSDFRLLHALVHRGQNALVQEFHLRLLVADHRGQGILVRGGSGAGEYLQPPLVPFRRLHIAPQGRSSPVTSTTAVHADYHSDSPSLSA